MSGAALGDRGLFPDLQPRAYLNHAAVSPPSVPVREAVTAYLDDFAAHGLGAVGRSVEQRGRLKEKIASLVGVRPGDLGLVQSTTVGVTDIALCFPWKRGDRVVLFEGEFPANVTPWQRAADLFELEVVFLPLEPFREDPAAGLALVEAELGRGARLVAVSAVQFQTGLRMPVDALARRCHAHDAQLFVDAIQAVGAVPLDLGASGVDYAAFGGHKWLMGLEGAGFLYVRPDRAAALEPRVAGWLSHEDGLEFLLRGPGHLRYDRPFKRSTDVVEGGACNAAGYAALEAAVDQIASLGVEAIHAHANAYLDALEPALVERGFVSLRSPRPEARSCILGVLPPAGVDVVPLHRALGARGIACTIPDGVLRFAPHWPNHVDEVPIVLRAVDEALAPR